MIAPGLQLRVLALVLAVVLAMGLAAVGALAWERLQWRRAAARETAAMVATQVERELQRLHDGLARRLRQVDGHGLEQAGRDGDVDGLLRSRGGRLLDAWPGTGPDPLPSIAWDILLLEDRPGVELRHLQDRLLLVRRQRAGEHLLHAWTDVEHHLLRRLPAPGWHLHLRLQEDGSSAGPPRPDLPAATLQLTPAGDRAALVLPARSGRLYVQLIGPGPAQGPASVMLPVLIAVGILALLAAAVPATAWARACRRLQDAWKQVDVVDGSHPLPLLRGGPAELRACDAAAAALVERFRVRLASLQAAVQDQERVSALQRRFLRRTLAELQHPLLVVEQLAAGPETAAGAAAARAVAERLILLRGMDVEMPGPEQPGRRLDLPAFCDQLQSLLAPLARQRGVQLQVQGEEAQCICDDRALAQVLVGLLANACVAAGATTVQCRLACQDDQLLGELVDDGGGLSAALADRLRTACSRGGILPGEAGVGLGLPLVLAQLRCLDGRLELLRTGPAGTAFRLQVPVA